MARTADTRHKDINPQPPEANLMEFLQQTSPQKFDYDDPLIPGVT